MGLPIRHWVRGMKTSFCVLTALTLSLGLSGCSTPSAESLAQNDPWEKTNRTFFDFDMKLDHSVARPVAKGYRDVVPEFARNGIHNALTNLNSPVVLANDALQGDSEKFSKTLGRMVINSTIGIAGLIDVATQLGVPYHDNDFGITLGKAGAAEGSFLVLPFAGPKPPRDLVGSAVDNLFDPLTYARWHGKDTQTAFRFGLSVLDSRAAQVDEVENIERSSIDFYATSRNLYRQSRNAAIHDGDPDMDDLPNL